MAFEFPGLGDVGLIGGGELAHTEPETLRHPQRVCRSAGEIAELYGKARVQGRLFAEDINQLTGRGIPIIQQLARQFGVSDSQVKKLVETGQVGFPQIEQAFIAMTSQGGQFAGMMEAQSRTTTGMFSTLKDTVNEVFLALGQQINDAIRPLVGEAISMVQTLALMAAEAGQRVKDAIMFVVAAFRSGEILGLCPDCRLTKNASCFSACSMFCCELNGQYVSENALNSNDLPHRGNLYDLHRMVPVLVS